jgi:dihydroorotate dehydrogenase (fumarate)
MADLTATYMGLSLQNPLIVGSSSLTMTQDGVKAVEEAGAGAVVLKSIFEEQIRLEVGGEYDQLDTRMHAEAYEYLRADLPMRMGPEKYVERLEAIKAAVRIPVFASVNCVTAEEWTAFARQLEAAGADGLELNVYDIPSAPDQSGADVEERHTAIVKAVKLAVSIPVAVKIGCFYSSLPAFVCKLQNAGADAVVLFNRFFQPDIDIDTIALKSTVHFSRAEDLLMPLRWTALLRRNLSCDLALSGGIHDAAGLIKAVLAGANVAQVCSVVYQEGAGVVSRLLRGLESWMDEKGFASLADVRGRLSTTGTGEPSGFERAQYIKTLTGVE